MLILAHRGLVGSGRPENTVAAVAAAFASGADGAEVDLRLTSDGVLAASHDPDLGRLAGAPIPVADTSWPVLDAAAAQRGLRLARLEELLVGAAGRRMVLEVKDPPPAPQAHWRTAETLVSVLRELGGSGVRLDVTVSSFSPALLSCVRRSLGPDSPVRTALLGMPLNAAPSLLRHALAGGHHEMHPHVLALLAQTWVVQAAHACGVAVVPWTVNRRRDLHRLERARVDAVITDDPAGARAAAAPALA